MKPQVDSFNLPLYVACPKEIAAAVERNGQFSIERLMLTDIASAMNWEVFSMHLKARLEGIFSKHFISEIIDELFERFHKKIMEFFEKLESMELTQLFVVLKRK